MATENKHIVKLWRGSRESYNNLKDTNKLDYWTRYSVKEPSGTWSEYFGNNLMLQMSGQLLPVIDIVPNLPSQLNNGDRYLVGHDAENGQPAEYYIVEVGISSKPETEGQKIQNTLIKPFDDKYTVRVKNRDYKSYGLINGKITTYDGNVVFHGYDYGTF